MAKKEKHLLYPYYGSTGKVGFIDDYKKLVLKNTKGLKPSSKMLGLLIISVLFTLYLLRGINLGTSTIIPFMKTLLQLD